MTGKVKLVELIVVLLDAVVSDRKVLSLTLEDCFITQFGPSGGKEHVDLFNGVGCGARINPTKMDDHNTGVCLKKKDNRLFLSIGSASGSGDVFCGEINLSDLKSSTYKRTFSSDNYESLEISLVAPEGWSFQIFRRR